MISADIKRTLVPHLAGQLERGLAVLFTGAGFSMACKNIRDEPMPSARKLRELLWDLCFPGKPFSAQSSLPDLYSFAQIRQSNQMSGLLRSSLTVQEESIPDFYRAIFSLPWYRCFTLNIDNVATAVSARYTLPRPTVAVSATAIGGTGTTSNDAATRLEVIHLNGTLEDLPDNVTFSPMQYAERLSRPDPWYVAFVANLLSHSIVFMGTTLEESPLWQHIEMRKMRGGRKMQELRPRSYLIIPDLDPAKQALLTEFNVMWVPATAEQFSSEILPELQEAAARGITGLLRNRGARGEKLRLPHVSELANSPLQASEFLLGTEPIWADIQAGRAIERDHDQSLWAKIEAALAQDVPGVVVVSGTAGAGKSTALMRAALHLTAEGKHVGWLDKDSDYSPREIRISLRAPDAPEIIAIDDADLFGQELANLVREIAASEKNPLIITAIRAGKIDRVLSPIALGHTPLVESVVPHLSDGDIGALIDVLDRENRLGKLKGKSRAEQEAMFRVLAGRQLLVAMLSATSGEPFKEKPIQELNDLSSEGRQVYALIAVASAFRFHISRDEIIMASGDRSNAALNALEALTRRHIVTTAPDGSLKARHRVISDLILDELQRTGELSGVIEGLSFVAATKVTPELRRNARPWRMLRSLLNHEFLARAIYPDPARNLYSGLEQLLSWDYHYWLQRGSLEVEFGSVALAENFLSQARGLTPDDPKVETEWAYLLFRKALESPIAPESSKFVQEAVEILNDLIDRPGQADSYPYHVLGSQGLSWARRSPASRQDKQRFLAQVLGRLDQAKDIFTRSPEIIQLHADIKREYLMMSVELQRTLL